MQKIKTFFNTFYKSLTSPKYYGDILQAKFSFSLKYFLVLVLITSLANTAVLSFYSFPTLVNTIKKVREQALNLYPKDLVITAKEGRLSANQESPIIMPFPDKDGENILVFDLNGTIDDLKTYNTTALINRSNIIVAGEGGQIRVQPLKDIPDGSLTYDDFSKTLTKFKNLTYYIPAFLTIAMFINVFLVLLILGLTYSTILSIILWTFSKRIGFKITFVKLNQISLHAITLAILLEPVSKAFGLVIAVIYGLTIMRKLSYPKNTHEN